MHHRAVGTIFCVLSVPLSAQWLNYPAPGIPRLPNARPNLAAPAPKASDGRPDLSGVWTHSGNIAYDMKPGDAYAPSFLCYRLDGLPFQACSA
jgi:hypothetical protein